MQEHYAFYIYFYEVKKALLIYTISLTSKIYILIISPLNHAVDNVQQVIYQP